MLHGVSLLSSPSDRPTRRLRFLMVAAAAAVADGNMLLGQLLHSPLGYPNVQILCGRRLRDFCSIPWNRKGQSAGMEGKNHATSKDMLALLRPRSERFRSVMLLFDERRSLIPRQQLKERKETEIRREL